MTGAPDGAIKRLADPGRIEVMARTISSNPMRWAEVGGSQAKLAESLVTKLGFKGAVQACRSNAWDGILEFVLLLENDLSKASPGGTGRAGMKE